MAKKSPAIGIDLGTTYSCVAVWEEGKVEIIANDQGNRTTPSYVAFTDTERLIGEAAKFQVAGNPMNTIFDAKRLIGRKFKDEKVQEDLRHWPFKVVGDAGGNPRFEVTFKDQVEKFAPEEISAMVLTKMKEIAEGYLGSKVTDAVITVPAYFNDAQRQATIDAAKIAGLNVLRIVNEPTAAALAYGLDKKLKGEKTVLVFDLGGGTFDVSILTIKEGSFISGDQKFVVRSTSGDTNLGGEDFDSRLVTHMIQMFKQKHKKDLSSNAKAIKRLRSKCETAKRVLSTSNEVTIEVDALWEGVDFFAKISRMRFEDLCSDLLDFTIEPVKKALADAGLLKSHIDEVVLVGGSTRIPKIQKMLQEFFNGKQLNKSINQDEAVAHGAAILAATLSGLPRATVPSFSLEEVTPLAVGVDTYGGLMSVMIHRNSKIPIKKYREYTNRDDNQTAVEIKVYEGERPLTKNNYLLGKFELEIPPHPAGRLGIDVTFEIDANGIMNVSALETCTGKQNKIIIKKENGRLSKRQIDRMIFNARKYKDQDERLLENAAARRKLENYANSIQGLSTRGTSLCKEVFRWLDFNMQVDKEFYENKLEEIREELESEGEPGCASGTSNCKKRKVNYDWFCACDPDA